MKKYQYIDKTTTWTVRWLYAFGLASWFLVLWGFSGIIAVDPLYRYFVAPLLFFMTAYHVVSYGIILFYRKFDLSNHFAKVAFARDAKNSVDVFLPICGESEEVLTRTWKAVSNLNYENFKVYVLDDSRYNLKEHRELAHEFGFYYTARPNRGEMKKAGNLKYAYERTNGEFIVIFDADFAPHPNFLKHTIPYMSNANTAIVQTPQYFETRNSLEYGAAYVQEDFYRFIQVARDRLGGALCCGSNALYRRSALDMIGGTAQVEHSEDAITGFRLTAMGWKVKYLPIILATGFCPDNIHAYAHQQHRWASGSMLLMKSKEFWTSKLSIKQKLCYISGFMYYLHHPIAILLSFQVFIALLAYNDNISFANALPFYPYIIWSMVLLPIFRIMPLRFGSFYAGTLQLYVFSHAVISAFKKKSVEWISSGEKTQKTSKMYGEVFRMARMFLSLNLLLLSIAAAYGLFHPLTLRYYSIQIWIFYNMFLTTALLFGLYNYSKKL